MTGNLHDITLERLRRVVAEHQALLQEAHDRRAWAALGYPSWEAYCVAEFGAEEGAVFAEMVDR